MRRLLFFSLGIAAIACVAAGAVAQHMTSTPTLMGTILSKPAGATSFLLIQTGSSMLIQTGSKLKVQ